MASREKSSFLLHVVTFNSQCRSGFESPRILNRCSQNERKNSAEIASLTQQLREQAESEEEMRICWIRPAPRVELQRELRRTASPNSGWTDRLSPKAGAQK